MTVDGSVGAARKFRRCRAIGLLASRLHGVLFVHHRARWGFYARPVCYAFILFYLQCFTRESQHKSLF